MDHSGLTFNLDLSQTDSHRAHQNEECQKLFLSRLGYDSHCDMLLRNWQMVTFQSRDQLNELHGKKSGNSYDESNLSIFFCDLIQDNSEQNEWVENSVNIAIDQSPAWSKSILKSTRATRKDVYRRKMLRAIKKFFLMLFKYHNNKLVNKRLSKVSSTQILQTLEDLSVLIITLSCAINSIRRVARILSNTLVFTNPLFYAEFTKYKKSLS
ncbi:unnamed protein product [Moneuplotes crassus]|uniref:Uncharacterized protein n=1 Tax=Euplotes crassus TaxID=5936 RepID=A0AAD1XZK7_EUPCR|nr:unnamed protein product [Moneuplotes crassus]